MTAIEIARRLSQLGEKSDACAAYALVLQSDAAPPAERLEASCYLLENGKDSRIPITALIQLFNEGFFSEDIFRILTRMFYQSRESDFRKRYQANCKLLSKYPYLFRKDFPPFENLPVRFLPFGEKNRYIPFSPSELRFDPFVNVRDTIISRNFFRDLEKPILADDVYSQYELEYLRDNVRLSEYIGRENHVYLHYSDWVTFCSWLQILDFRALLKTKQFVFLIEDEIGRYPIDFQAEFGVDYSQYPLRRVKIREVKRLIWHAQLSSSNGGDFFNEVFDAHPNLYYITSLMYADIAAMIERIKDLLRKCHDANAAQKEFQDWKKPWIARDLYGIKNRTDKDILVAVFMDQTSAADTLDASSRIVPALLLQPHFSDVNTTLSVTDKGDTVLDTDVYDIIHASPLLNGFPYVKTFIPLRRFTSSYGSTLRFMERQLPTCPEPQANGKPKKEKAIMPDLQIGRILNRTYLRNPENRLFRDSVIVRFEDGKLNPEATFRKLAEFLDLPYTESMTYCSVNNVRNARSEQENVIGFDPETVYRTYSEYVTDSDRCFIEYFMRDAYQYYGYAFQSYDGTPVDTQRIQEWMNHFDRLEKNMRESWRHFFELTTRDLSEKGKVKTEDESSTIQGLLDKFFQDRDKNRRFVTETLQRNLRFVNKNGQPLEMTPMLQPNPNLLVQPLYH